MDDVAITTDCWTAKSNEGYITVTCHFVDTNFELKSLVLSTEKLLTPTNHKADNIANTLRCILTEWDVFHKVDSIVTDNDATMKKPVNSFKRNTCRVSLTLSICLYRKF